MLSDFVPTVGAHGGERDAAVLRPPAGWFVPVEHAVGS